MSAPPFLSVITICRNVLPALRKTVESVLGQGADGVEYLIVDGASSDGTVEYVRGLEARGVRWISEPDRGISDAMNKGARLARASWIAHLHADDVYLPGALARVRREIEVDDADILCGWMMKEEDHDAVLCRCAPERLPWDMTLNHPATVVRRAWFDRLGGFDERLSNAMDYDFFLRARLAGARFRVVPAALVAMAGGGQSERSLWRTLRETHDIRRRHLATGLGRSPAWLAYLWTKGSTRVALQRLGLDGLVRWWRRTLAYPPKGD